MQLYNYFNEISDINVLIKRGPFCCSASALWESVTVVHTPGGDTTVVEYYFVKIKPLHAVIQILYPTK